MNDIAKEFEYLYWTNWLLRLDEGYWKFAVDASSLWLNDKIGALDYINRVRAAGRPASKYELKFRLDAEIFVLADRRKQTNESILLTVGYKPVHRRSDDQDARVNEVYDSLQKEFFVQNPIAVRLEASGFKPDVIYRRVGGQRVIDYPSLIALVGPIALKSWALSTAQSLTAYFRK